MHSEISGTVDFYETERRGRHRASFASSSRCSPSRRTDRQTTLKLLATEQPDERRLRHRQPRRSQGIRCPRPARCIVDAGSISEYKSDYGQTLVCAYAKVGGESGRHRRQPAHAKEIEEAWTADRRRDLRRQRRQGRAVHHGLQPDAAADHLRSGRAGVHGRARCRAGGHHPFRREDGERDEQLHGAEDHA